MKTLDELFSEISGNKQLQERFAAASKSAEELAAFFREHGCETAIADIRKKMSEISLDELEQVSGGAESPVYNCLDRRDIVFTRTMVKQVNENLKKLLQKETES